MVQLKKPLFFPWGEYLLVTSVIPREGFSEGLCSVEHFWSCSLEGRSGQQGIFIFFFLQYSAGKKWESLVHMRGVTFRVQHTCTLPTSKAFHRNSSASKASEGRVGAFLHPTPRTGMTSWPLSPSWHQQRFTLAALTMQCKMVFKNKFASSHQPSSPVLDTMVMETATGMESGDGGREHCRVPINAEILLQKHKTETEQCIFGIKPRPLILVALSTCSSYSKNVLKTKSPKQSFKDEGKPLVCFPPCLLTCSIKGRFLPGAG